MSVSINLRPFQHQVSGHASLMTTEDCDVIMKPLIPAELDLYVNMPQVLLPFTPEFKGLAEIKYTEVDGEVTCVAEVPLRHNGWCKTRNNIKTADEGNVLIPYDGLEKSRFDENAGFQRNRWTRDKDPRADTSGLGQNPWAKRVQQQTITKMNNGTDAQSFLKACIVLENISRKFRHPCILDLKVGTRLYGDDCPRDKVLRHNEKNLLSTTSSLGLRLSGLQVYQNSRYLCRDKFFGRGLSDNGFIDALRLFFTDGARIRTSVIDSILSRIELLAAAVSSLNNCRLFGTSLVILYDGADPDRRNLVKRETVDERLVEMRLVDFAHCSFGRTDRDKTREHDGCDTGFLFGLKTLCSLLSRLKNSDTISDEE